MTKHLILDFESIGADIFNSPLLSCAYMVFDWGRFTSDKPYTFNELTKNITYKKFKLKPQIEAGRKYSKSDLQWWLDQGEVAQKQLKPSQDDISVDQFIKELYTDLKGEKIYRWWSRGNSFDPPLLQREFVKVYDSDTLNKILPFWNVRDVRTFIDTRFDFKLKKTGFCPIDDEDAWDKFFVLHDPVHDLAADIMRLQKIERVINVSSD